MPSMPGFGDYGHVPPCPGHPEFIDPDDAYADDARAELIAKHMTNLQLVDEAMGYFSDDEYAAICKAVRSAYLASEDGTAPSDAALQLIGHAVYSASLRQAELSVTEDGIQAEAKRLRLEQQRNSDEDRADDLAYRRAI